MISFSRIDVGEMPWEKLSDFYGANIFHTRAWIDFLSDFFGFEPVIAAIQSDGHLRGYFMGLITKKSGIRILGSPFRDWNTYFMGFNLMPEVSYHDVLQAFPNFAFDELKCHFLMIIDANLNKTELQGLPYHVRNISNFTIDLRKDEAELFASMNRSCRHQIRGAIRKGVTIEEVADPGFADEFYSQYQEVMARQSLLPLYSLDFLRRMITNLLPTGNLILLKAKNSEGTCIATSIDLLYNKVAVGWAGASRRQYHKLHPNELIIWHEMRKVKSMGAEFLHLAATNGQFKMKFGAYEVQELRLMMAAKPLLYYPLFIIISLNERLRFWMRKYKRFSLY